MTKLYSDYATGCTDGACLFVDNSNRVHTNSGCSCARALMRTKEGRDAMYLIMHLRNIILNPTELDRDEK